MAETTGQIVGETVHQIGEVATSLSEIPEAFSRGYEKELFDKSDKPNENNTEEES